MRSLFRYRSCDGTRNPRLAAIVFSAAALTTGCDRVVSEQASIAQGVHIERPVAHIAGSDADYYLTINATPVQNSPSSSNCSATVNIRFTSGRPSADNAPLNDLYQPFQSTIRCGEPNHLNFGHVKVTFTLDPNRMLSYSYNTRL